MPVASHMLADLVIVVVAWLVEAIVGHSNPTMTRHYTHISEVAAAAAVNLLPAVMGEGAKVRRLLPGAVREPGMVYEAEPTPAARLRAAVGHPEGMTAKTWSTARKAALADVRAALAWIEGRILHEAPPATA